MVLSCALLFVQACVLCGELAWYSTTFDYAGARFDIACVNGHMLSVQPTLLGMQFVLLSSFMCLLALLYVALSMRMTPRLGVFIVVFQVSMHMFFLASDLVVMGVAFELQSFALLGLVLLPSPAPSSRTAVVKASPMACLLLLLYSLVSGALYV